MQIHRCSSAGEEEASGSVPLLGNTSCHGLCQFSSIQLLSALSVYIGCLQLRSQCGTGIGQGELFCVVCLLPSSRVIFYIWYKWNNRTRFGEKHVMFLGKHQQNNFRRIANVPNVNKWMFWMVKLSFGSFPLSVKQMFWYSKQEHYFVPFISLNYKQGCFWKPVCSYFTNTSY